MENSTHKIFTNKAISVATFFGGFIAAGFLISKNYKVFGKENAARNSIFIAIIATVILFTGVSMIPENINNSIPSALISGIYTLIIAGIVEKFQGKEIKEFLDNDGLKASNWQAAKYGLLGLSINIGLLLLIVFSSSNDGYDKSINIEKNIVLHYSNQIDEVKSQILANTIKQSKFMEGSDGADLFLSDEKNNYKLKFVITDTTVLSDTLVISEFNRLEKYINYNSNFGRKIEIGFTDYNLQKDFELMEMSNSEQKVYEPLLYLNAYPINEYHTIFYNANMPVDDVKKVENAIKRLKSYFPNNQRIDIVFLNNDNKYVIKFFVVKNLWQNPSIIARLKSTIEYIKNNGIDKNIELVLVDNITFEEKSI